MKYRAVRTTRDGLGIARVVARRQAVGFRLSNETLYENQPRGFTLRDREAAADSAKTHTRRAQRCDGDDQS